MSGNSGPFMFSYNSKNTLNRIIFDSNRRRREGVENAAPAPSLVEAKPGKSPAASLLGRKTPSQARSFQSNFCNSVDEVQQQLNSSPIAYQASQNGAYTREKESISVSPGYKSSLQVGRNFTEQLLPSPPPEVYGMSFNDCVLQLQNWNNQLQDKNTEMSRKLSDLLQKQVTAELELKDSRQIATSAMIEVKTKEAEKKLLENLSTETKAHLAKLVQDNDCLKTELALAKAEVQRLKDSCKTRLSQFSESLAGLGSGLRELGQAHSSSREQLQLLRIEVDDTKRKATNSLEALQPILDDNGSMTRTQEMKDLLKDLQESLVSSHQVTDILRAKIMYQASQLADAQARVKELEEESLAKLFITNEDNKRTFSLLVDLGKNVEEVTTKLVMQEEKAVDALVASASLEENLQALSNELESCKVTCAKEREENLSKLLLLQNTINSRDKEIATLKAELRGLKESKEDLRILLAEAKKDLAERELEIRARDPNIEFQLKIEDLTEGVRSLKIQLQEAEDKHKFSIDDWLAQERSLKKKLYESEGQSNVLRTSNEELRAELSSLRAELTTLVIQDHDGQEALRTVTAEVSRLRGRLDAQVMGSSKSKEDYDKLNLQFRNLEARMEEKERIIQVQERRASAAEESVGWAKERLGAANRKNEELEARIATIQHDASLTQKAAEQALSSTKNESHAQLTILQKQISQLENVNAEANVRAEKLIELYRTGKLTDLEKSFVSHIISETEAIQEERIVRKDNELRLREISLENVNSKLAIAQETILRLLAEKNGNGGEKSMVDLGMVSFEVNKPVVGLVPDDALEDSTLLMGLQSELDVEDDNKHGIKRSRSPSPRRLQGELAKRSKRPPIIEGGSVSEAGLSSGIVQQKLLGEGVAKKTRGKKKK